MAKYKHTKTMLAMLKKEAERIPSITAYLKHDLKTRYGIDIDDQTHSSSKEAHSAK